MLAIGNSASPYEGGDREMVRVVPDLPNQVWVFICKGFNRLVGGFGERAIRAYQLAVMEYNPLAKAGSL